MPTYDLSHPIESEMPVYPGTDPVALEPTATVAADGYRTTRLSLDSHTGTHLDAPAHMVAEGRTLEEYPPETFRFTALVADVRPLEARERITARDLLEAVDESALTAVDLLVVRTGWDAHWGDDRYLDHPFPTSRAAELLCEWRCHLGVDLLNVDPTPTENAAPDEPDDYPVHQTLFADDRLVLENLCGLDRLPTDTPFEVHAYPLPIRDADGAPTRAVAIV
ncbi:cyclase family protein [Natrononativus amylolyticus]|uniref:cyclase family protein n=1 Tax=Natrononativus amylolyticus TaxID=2963434 RepID=UPI0020CDAA1B|nr:cyclase family protein [Natrononativus amylolyticus]